MAKRNVVFGIMLQGAGENTNSWRHPSVPVDASVNFPYFAKTVRRAEDAGIAFAFVADGLHINQASIPHFLNRFEPISLLSALSATTSKIGLVGTVSTSYSDPYTTARQFASLDLLSGGRAGWNVVTSALEGAGKNFGRSHPDHAQRYRIAEEHVQVTSALWDSWDDDAFIRDRSSGVFADKKKLHTLNHEGEFFSVAGPLNIQRSAQGHPVIFQAGASGPGISLAGKYADAVFVYSDTVKDGRAVYDKLKSSAHLHGRSASDLRVCAGIFPIVGRTSEEAEAKYQAIRDLVSIDEALLYLGRFFDHHDFSIYPLDAPFPDIGDVGQNSFRATTDRIKQRAASLGLSLREVALDEATPRSTFVGAAEDVATEIARWVDGGAADGFVLIFQVIGEGLEDFASLVLPILKERGYFNPALEGKTLRDHLGLPFRESRYRSVAEGLETPDVHEL